MESKIQVPVTSALKKTFLVAFHCGLNGRRALFRNTYCLSEGAFNLIFCTFLKYFTTFLGLGISPNLASYLTLVHRPNFGQTNLMTENPQEQLETEYLKLKGNLTVQELYGRIVPK